MRQKIIGTYEAGFEAVELVLREGTGGEFYTIPEKGKICRIKIGGDYKRWDEVVNVLLHEIVELQLFRKDCRLENSNDISRDHAGYLFVATHPQFSDAIAKAAEFIAPALPDLAKAWAQWKKKK